MKAGLYKMQVRALLEAAQQRADVGGTPVIEIMIPLVVTKAEVALVRRWVEEEVERVRRRVGTPDRCEDRDDDRDAPRRGSR